MKSLIRISLPLFFISTFIIFSSNHASAQTRTGYWTSFDIPGDSLSPYRLVFADSLVGYLQCADRGNFFANMYYRTLDGGTTWLPMTFGKLAYDHYTSVAGRPQDTAYGFYPGGTHEIQLSSHFGAYTRQFEYDSTLEKGERALLLKTTDAGATWKEEATNKGYTDRFWDLIHFFNDNYGLRWQIPEGTTNKGAVFYTPNGGQSFFQKSLNFDFPNNGNSDTHGLMFFDSSHWFITDSLTALDHFSYHLNNTGGWWDWDSTAFVYPATWKYPDWHIRCIGFTTDGKNITQPVSGTPNGFLFTGPDQGYLYGDQYYSNDFSDTMVTFFATTDYGRTWTPNYSFRDRARGFEGTSANDIWMTVLPKDLPFEYYPMHDTEIWRVPAVTRDSQISASWIVHSLDGGVTWDIDQTTLRRFEGPEYDGEVISSSDPEHVWIGAELNNHTTIFKYHAYPKASVETEPPSSPYVPMDLPFWVNVYPNPAEEHTTVALARGDPMRNVEVYDLLGRKMNVGVDRLSESSVSLNVTNLRAGAYSVVFDDYYTRLSKLFLVRH